MAPKAKGQGLGRGKAAHVWLKGVDEGAMRGNVSRWSHDDAEPGAALMGRLIAAKPVKFKDGKDGYALVFSPAITTTADGETETHRTIETLLSATLAQKITPETDKGVTFAIVYTGREKSEHKGRADFKTFDVAAVGPDALRKELESNGAPELAALLASLTE